MNLNGKIILITGANRGIGKALLAEALKRGAKKVYAASRGTIKHDDSRVDYLELDVTDDKKIENVGKKVGSLDVLINNAGIALYDDPSNIESIQKQFEVNLFGMSKMTYSLLPQLKAARGAVVNNLSILGLAPLPLIPGYSISKAAAISMTQSLRALLSGQGVSVHAVLLGPIDTDMNRGLDIPKTPTDQAARGIFDGLEKMEEEIFPDPASQAIAEGWRAGVAKGIEKQLAGFLPTSSTTRQ